MNENWPHLKVEQTDNLLWVTLNRPEAKNAISLEMIDSLEKVFHRAEKESSVRVVILKAEGSVFCAGGDFKEMQARQGMFGGESAELKLNYHHGIQRIPRLLEKFPKPLIAMMDGGAIGAGCDLACMCDMRIGTEKSFFAETFSKLNLVPGDGGTFFLPRLVGYPFAMEMFLTGRKVKAKEAQEKGLLNYLETAENLEKKTLEVAAMIAANAPYATQLTKRSLKQARTAELELMLDQLSSYQAIAQRMKDHDRGLEALSKRQTPHFIGD